METSVSVVIPTWNRADTIEQALESALQQSLPVLEILVCDDGSTDQTTSIVADAARRDARVRWLPGARGGRPAIPRNRGLRECRGEWVAFLDSDDAWQPRKLEVQLDAARQMGVLAVCSNAMRVDPEGREKGALLEWSRTSLALGDLLAENRVVCSSALLHRSLLSRTGGFPEGVEFKAVEDYALWLRVAALTDIAYCRDTLVRYRDHPTASIRSEQDIAPRAQRSLVLGATATWLLAAEMTTPRRVAALARVGMARLRHAAGGAVGSLRRGSGT